MYEPPKLQKISVAPKNRHSHTLARTPRVRYTFYTQKLTMIHRKREKRFWNIDRIMHLILGIAGAAVLIYLVRRLDHVLLPFFVACFVAYVLQPLVRFNQKWTHINNRVVASILTLIEVSAVIGLLVYLFLPSVINQIDKFDEVLRNVSSGKKAIPAYCRTIVDFINRYFDPVHIKAMISESHIETLLNKGSSLLEESIDVLVKTVAWLLTLIYILFILIDYPRISRGFKLIIPHKYRSRAMTVVRDVQYNMDHYFRGQGLVALCATVFYCVGFSIVGLPLAIPMGIIVGILYMIPYFQYVTVIPVAIICFIYSLGADVGFFAEFGKCLLVYVISQCICDYIITPHIMGKELGMNPAIILLALSVWGSLLGIIGMIIALPVTSLIMSYYERYISNPKTSRRDTQNRREDMF